MTVLDIVLLALLGWFVIRGLFRGFLLELFDLVSLVAGYFAARWLGPGLGWWLADAWGLDRVWTALIATVLVFAGVTVAVRMGARVLKKIVHASLLGGLDRGLGALFGALKTVLLAVALFFIVLMSPWGGRATAYAQGGAVSRYLVYATRGVQHWLADRGHDPVQRVGRWMEDGMRPATMAMADWLRAAGAGEETVNLIADQPALFDAILQRAKEIDLEVPVEQIRAGAESLDLPEGWSLDPADRERLVEVLEQRGADVEEKAREFWEVIAREAPPE